MVIVGIIIELMLGKITLPDSSFNPLYGFLASIFITIFVWEGSFRIDQYMNAKFPWEIAPVKRSFIQAVSFPIIRPFKNRENNLKSLNLKSNEKIKIYRNADC